MGTPTEHHNNSTDEVDFTLNMTWENNSNKRGPKAEIEPVDQLFMLLTWFRNGFTLRPKLGQVT